MEAKTKKVVTFLFGNGFDVGMGMKSQYADFYRVYTDKKSPYYPKNNDYLAKKIASDQSKRADHWSYYEKWFGDLTKKNDWKKQIKPDDLLKRNEEFQQHFYRYLKEQEARLIFKMDNNKTDNNEIKSRLLEDLGREMASALRGFYDEKNILDGAAQIRPILDSDGIDARIEYQFVCFNYSSVLDQCVDAMKAFLEKAIDGILAKAMKNSNTGKDIDFTESEMDVFVDKKGHKNFKWSVSFFAKEGYSEVLRSKLEEHVEIGSVHHGHGALKESEQTVLVMGVNDDSQAGDEFGRNQNVSRRNRLVKKNIMISNHKRWQWDKTMDMIEQSDIIVVYGMSIGDTDQDYWKKLYDWLLKDPNHQLVFYIYDKSFDPYDPHRRNEIVDFHEKKFREMTWKIDPMQKRCRVNDETFYFTAHNCPRKYTCVKDKCNCVTLEQWCQENGLCDSENDCKATGCPYNKDTDRYNCKSWRKIRKQIHFAIQKNIFGYDLVRNNYYPAVMFYLILNKILEDTGNGRWCLMIDQKNGKQLYKEIANLDSIALSYGGDAAAARAGLKLYCLFTKLMENIGPEGLINAAGKPKKTLDTTDAEYQMKVAWLQEELKKVEYLGADLKNYQKPSKDFVENLRKMGVCGKGQAEKIADFYFNIKKHWEKLK